MFSLHQLLAVLLSCHVALWLQRSARFEVELLQWLRGLQVGDSP